MLENSLDAHRLQGIERTDLFDPRQSLGRSNPSIFPDTANFQPLLPPNPELEPVPSLPNSPLFTDPENSYSGDLAANFSLGVTGVNDRRDGDFLLGRGEPTVGLADASIAATPSLSPGYRSTTGYGLVNAAAAVARSIGQTTPLPNVPTFGNKNDWGANLVNAPSAWAKGYTGQGIVVAVIDTGVDRNHPDLSGNIWKNPGEIPGDGRDNDGNGYVDDVYGWNFASGNNNTLDGNGHGTHVAGTIAGLNNGVGVTGIAYNSRIMPVKALSDSGSGSLSAIAKGIRYAVDNGARVINMSLGGGSTSREMQSALEYASSRGAIVVMAAGNEGAASPSYPGSSAKNWGITVGAVDNSNNLASFSNRAGSDPAMRYVTAPGVNVYSTLPNGRYGSLSGTSMATPHVSGVVALMLGANGNLDDAGVRNILTSTAGNVLSR
ncbi:S8 family peptidase [Pannus brasiliensis CCIBt3594]|uniref:S8 family peptidase n=1 Tax=Pannus brasiliensis CCIBt3594 TaxID=1427578 RepID=A0AAW9QVH1_9CHRO